MSQPAGPDNNQFRTAIGVIADQFDTANERIKFLETHNASLIARLNAVQQAFTQAFGPPAATTTAAPVSPVTAPGQVAQ